MCQRVFMNNSNSGKREKEKRQKMKREKKGENTGPWRERTMRSERGKRGEREKNRQQIQPWGEASNRESIVQQHGPHQSACRHTQNTSPYFSPLSAVLDVLWEKFKPFACRPTDFFHTFWCHSPSCLAPTSGLQNPSNPAAILSRNSFWKLHFINLKPALFLLEYVFVYSLCIIWCTLA